MISDNLTVDNVIALLVAKLAKEREEARARLADLTTLARDLRDVLQARAVCEVMGSCSECGRRTESVIARAAKMLGES